jgi:hypothetical protein
MAQLYPGMHMSNAETDLVEAKPLTPRIPREGSQQRE